jgi:antitoxin component YwqK of YwqJK toxin-antitoxin module
MKKISESKFNHKVYHKDGSLWAQGTLSKGKMEGYWEWFRKDGSKMRTGHFKDHKQTGEWITYDKKGKVVKVTVMK